MRPLLLAPLLLALAACDGAPGGEDRSSVEPETTAPHETASALDAYVNDAVRRLEIPGLAVAIVEGDAIYYTRAFGTPRLGSSEPLTVDHLFHFASVSKPFVATAIVQMVERGEVDLDAPVIDYLPYFPIGDRGVTIRRMLNHTSGMPDVADYEWERPESDEGAAERYVRSLGDRQLLFEPGKKFRYSNMAFDVLGDVIAKISGMSFERYVEAQILEPLRMHDSSFLYPATEPTLRTSGHVWAGAPVVSDVYPYNRRHAPSSTLNSSVVEMTHWAIANLNRGHFRDRHILRPESYDLLWGATAAAGDAIDVGLSWFVGEYRGERMIWHDGGDTGFTSTLALLPDSDRAVILASNYDRTPMRELRAGILEILAGEVPAPVRRRGAEAFADVLVTSGVEAALEHYRELQAEASDRYALGPSQLNGLGYYYLRNGEVERAIEVFRANVELYPEVANGWDSLGEALLVAGEREEGIRHYRKALALDPDFENPRRVLEELGVALR